MELEALIANAIRARVIDPAQHGPLMRNARRVAQRANIPMRALFTSVVGVVTDTEYDWVKAYRQHASDGTAGLLITAIKPARPILDRFSAIAAWAIRNSVRAQVLLLQDVFALLKEGEAPDPELLLIPDFVTEGLAVQAWQASQLSSLLYGRYAAGHQTVLYVQAELADAYKTVDRAYGVLMAQHVRDHFEKGTE